MCVIAYKAKGVRFMSKERIDEMWDANPDGAGVMWRDNETNKIQFVKGFMKKQKLEKWIRQNRDWLDEVELAVHFRITTHGGTSKGNCHPFVCDCDADPHLLNGEADFVLMHNGILPIRPRSSDISDSAELALRIGRFANPMDVMDICDELCTGSRIVIFGKDGTMMYGDEWKQPYDDGILYSNDHFVGTFGYGSFGYGIRGYQHFRPAAIGTSSNHGTVKVGDVVGKALDSLTDTQRAFIEWDEGNKKWVCTLSPDRDISLLDIDPDCLTAKDYDIYLDQMERYEECQAHDPELVEEANYYGMSVEDYLDYQYENGRGDDEVGNLEVEEVV